MPTVGLSTSGAGFLSFHHAPPRLYIIAETEEESFDSETIRAYRDEGFNVQYIDYENGGKSFTQKLNRLAEGLGVGEKYGIVAFGDAASVVLDHHTRSTPATSRLAALVAYYPSSIPDPLAANTFGVTLRVLVHLAGPSISVMRHSEVLGLQGKKRAVEKRVTPGIGVGGWQSKMRYPAFTYEGCDVGFAERDLEDWDTQAASLAFGRTVRTLRESFSAGSAAAPVELEGAWDEHTQHLFSVPAALQNGSANGSAAAPSSDKSLDSLMGTFTSQPAPTLMLVPTLAGSTGPSPGALADFLATHYFPHRPSSLRAKLLTRTISPTHVVDEILLSFKHTCAMPWILPGVPATGKDVEVVLLVSAELRAGKVVSERWYWDQGSVVLQVGVVDAVEGVARAWRKGGQRKKKGKGKAGKAGAAEKVVEELPIAGGEAARRVREPGRWRELENEMLELDLSDGEEDRGSEDD